jgi:3-phosphoshikimate 1-carboxyvinyltransferase
MGAPVTIDAGDDGDRIRLSAAGWDGRLAPLQARVPGDSSAAAFLAVAALLAGRSVSFRSIGLNPRRSGWITLVERMGAGVETRVTGYEAGEPVGDLTVRPASLAPFEIGPRDVPGLIDELPALAVLASGQHGVSEIRGAGELRVKESDRLALIAENFEALGIRCEELDDGLRVVGGAPRQGVVRTGGDHRIAMAFGALAASSGSKVHVDDMECVAVSFPGFWDALAEVVPGYERS